MELLITLFNSNIKIKNTAIILIYQLFANSANQIRIKNAPKIELNSNYNRIFWKLNFNSVRI